MPHFEPNNLDKPLTSWSAVCNQALKNVLKLKKKISYLNENSILKTIQNFTGKSTQNRILYIVCFSHKTLEEENKDALSPIG